MKRFISFILGSIFLWWGIAGANLLQNPGFENGMANWQMVSGSALLTDWHKSGAYAMQFSGDGDTLMRIQQINIPVNPNTEYRLWMCASVRYSSYPNSVRFRMWVDNLLIYEENNGSLSAPWISKSVTFNSGTTEMINVSFSCFWENTAITGGVLDDLILVEEDLIPPVMLSAEASDNEAIVPGVDNEDYIVIAFSEPMNKAKFSFRDNNPDSVLQLNNNHSWLNHNGNQGTIEWNDAGDSLWIYFAPGYPWASVFPGDIITPDGITICDEWGNPVTNTVVISGSFGGEYGYIAGNVNPNPFPPVPDSSGVRTTVFVTGQYDITDFGTGDYFIENVVTGDHKIIAARFLFMPETLQTTVVSGETTYVDFALNRYYILPPFSTDFEDDDAGFCGKLKGAVGSVQWVIDSLSYSGVRCWRMNAGGVPCSAYVYVPAIDLGSVSSVKLSFYHRRLYNTFTFTRKLQVSLDGTTWNTLGSYPGIVNNWVKDSIDIGVYVGDTIFIRFASEGNIPIEDWRIDDFCLSTSGSGSGIHVREQNNISLSQNIPNPVYSKTTIIYTIPEKTQIRLKIYDSSGRLVNTLVDKIQQPGEYSVTWNCMDLSNTKLASGIYFYCLKTDDKTIIRKLVLFR